KTANPAHGLSECEPGASVNIDSPAFDGRYGEIALSQLDGSRSRSGGITKRIPANVAIPPAVLRTIAPRPSAKTPTRARYRAPATTVRATPGCVNEISRMWWARKIVWLR